MLANTQVSLSGLIAMTFHINHKLNLKFRNGIRLLKSLKFCL